MNKILERIDKLGDYLSQAEIDAAIAILEQKKQLTENPMTLNFADANVLSVWFETKEIKGHFYKYQRWQEVVPSSTPGRFRVVTRSTYLGKAEG